VCVCVQKLYLYLSNSFFLFFLLCMTESERLALRTIFNFPNFMLINRERSGPSVKLSKFIRVCDLIKQMIVHRCEIVLWCFRAASRAGIAPSITSSRCRRTGADRNPAETGTTGSTVDGYPDQCARCTTSRTSNS